ncbi:hypothetical protein D9M71_337740 [compost metagenome]
MSKERGRATVDPPLVHPASESDLAGAFADDDRFRQKGLGRLTQGALDAIVRTSAYSRVDAQTLAHDKKLTASELPERYRRMGRHKDLQRLGLILRTE